MTTDDEEKRRVLTPPKEWTNNPREVSESEDPYVEDYDEDDEWLEEDDLELDDEPETEHETAYREEYADDWTAEDKDTPPSFSEQETLLADHQQAADEQFESNDINTRSYWMIFSVILIGLLGVGGWWGIDQRNTLTAEVEQLEGILQRTTRSTRDKDEELTKLRAESSALKDQITAIQIINESLTAKVTERRPSSNVKDSIDKAKAISNGTNQTQISIAGNASEQDKIADISSFPATTDDGTWFVNLESYSQMANAETRVERLNSQFPTLTFDVQRGNVDGNTLYRIRVNGFTNKKEAQSAASIFMKILKSGPLWVGRERVRPIETSSSAQQGNVRINTTQQPQPIRLRDFSNKENWFVYVDTYDQGDLAQEAAVNLQELGHNAKVTVESREGELFFRVQIVGIPNKAEGKQVITGLMADGNFGNLQLKRSIN